MLKSLIKVPSNQLFGQTCHTFFDQAGGFLSPFPTGDFNPFSFFEVFVAFEKVLDLIAQDLRQFFVEFDLGVIRVDFVMGTADKFFVMTDFVFHIQYPDQSIQVVEPCT